MKAQTPREALLTRLAALKQLRTDHLGWRGSAASAHASSVRFGQHYGVVYHGTRVRLLTEALAVVEAELEKVEIELKAYE